MLTPEQQEYANDFILGYVECGLWTDTYNEGGLLVQNESVDRIDEDSWDHIREVCESFVETHWDDLKGLEPQGAGCRFWLTQNGRLAGFWDMGLGAQGDRLTAAAKSYGEAWFYADDTCIRYEM